MSYSPEVYYAAMDFAAKAHRDQKFPGKDYSYVVHLAEVTAETMNIVFNYKTENPNLSIQCAILHDTIEDTDAKYDDLKSIFGVEVADGVLSLTKNMQLEKNQQMIDSLNRILLQPKDVQLVKIADRITNLQKPPDYWTKEKIIKYRNEAQIILDTLKDANDFAVNRLKLKIEEYKKYE